MYSFKTHYYYFTCKVPALWMGIIIIRQMMSQSTKHCAKHYWLPACGGGGVTRT